MQLLIFLESALRALLQMSLEGCVVILAVLALRLVLCRAPKIYAYGLWSAVLFRLLCPVSFQSALSLLNLLGAEKNTLPQDLGAAPILPVPPATPVPGPAVTPAPGAVPPTAAAQPAVEATLTWMQAAAGLWALGAVVMAVYGIVSLWRLRRRLWAAATKAVEHRHAERLTVYRVAGLGTAFVMGLWLPVVYLPEGLTPEEERYILAHENAHLRRGDPVWRFLAYLALCLHWFNLLVWLAFALSGRDMEMSCDEAVVNKLGPSVKKTYSASLLSLATGRRITLTAPLAFGEGDTGTRIKNVLHYKKPAFWLAAATGLLVAVLCLFLAGDPAEGPLSPASEEDTPKVTSMTLTSVYGETGCHAAVGWALPEGWSFRVTNTAAAPEAGLEKELGDLVADDEVIGQLYVGRFALPDSMLWPSQEDPNRHMMAYNGFMLGSIADWNSDYTVLQADTYTEAAVTNVYVRATDGGEPTMEHSAALYFDLDVGMYLKAVLPADSAYAEDVKALACSFTIDSLLRYALTTETVTTDDGGGYSVAFPVPPGWAFVSAGTELSVENGQKRCLGWLQEGGRTVGTVEVYRFAPVPAGAMPSDIEGYYDASDTDYVLGTWYDWDAAGGKPRVQANMHWRQIYPAVKRVPYGICAVAELRADAQQEQPDRRVAFRFFLDQGIYLCVCLDPAVEEEMVRYMAGGLALELQQVPTPPAANPSVSPAGQAVSSWQADLDNNGIQETLTLTEQQAGLFALAVQDAAGNVLHTFENISTSHAGWATFAVFAGYEGRDILMEYYPRLSTGAGEYLCRYWYVNERGEFAVWEESYYAFSAGMPYNAPDNDVHALSEFAEYVNEDWSHSRLLFTTDGMVIGGLCDAQGQPVTVPDRNGLVTVADGAPVVQYRETMPWVDVFLLEAGYDKGDPIFDEPLWARLEAVNKVFAARRAEVAMQTATAVWQLELKPDEGNATEMLMLVQQPDGLYALEVRDEYGEVLHTFTGIGTVRSAQTTFAMHGDDFLMEYRPYDAGDGGDYRYTLWELDWESGWSVKVKEETMVSFTAGMPYNAPDNDAVALADFAAVANDLWANSRLLFTTDETVMAGLCDADGRPVTLPAENGFVMVADDGPVVQYRETMPWVDRFLKEVGYAADDPVFSMELYDKLVEANKVLAARRAEVENAG